MLVVEGRSARQTLNDVADLESVVGHGERLVTALEALASQFGLSDDVPIDIPNLPPAISGSDADQAHVRAAAPLYLAAELDAAGLVPTCELLAGLFASGALANDLGLAAAELARFWHERNQRFSSAERQAMFARLFGESTGSTLATEHERNSAFEPLMIDVTEALYRLDPSGQPLVGAWPPSEIPLLMAARELAGNLVPRSGGIAIFAAREMLATIRIALRILGTSALQAAFGARSAWGVVRTVQQRYGHSGVESHVSLRVDRGKSGLAVLAWLADNVPRLDTSGGQTSLGTGHDVIRAAGTWLQSSLALHEREQSGVSLRER
ncbi:MAG TPA: hypothetical protein VGL99_31455 [Chloroflexota bacterium]